MMRRVLLLMPMLLLVSCTSGRPPASAPSATGSSVTSGMMNEWQLRFLLLDKYPDHAFCDPDQYPIARAGGEKRADEWYAQQTESSPEIRAILEHLPAKPPLTTAQKRRAYELHKRLASISLAPHGDSYTFTLTVGADQPERRVTGTISNTGKLSGVATSDAAGGCPICLELGTRIATPTGDIEVSHIRVGDLVWAPSRSGRVRAIVRAVTRRRVMVPHRMIALTLADGRTVIGSPAHPGLNGTIFAELIPGSALGGSRVSAQRWVDSISPYTYDLRTSAPGGGYYAGGIPLGSTIPALR